MRVVASYLFAVACLASFALTTPSESVELKPEGDPATVLKFELMDVYVSMARLGSGQMVHLVTSTSIEAYDHGPAIEAEDEVQATKVLLSTTGHDNNAAVRLAGCSMGGDSPSRVLRSRCNRYRVVTSCTNSSRPRFMNEFGTSPVTSTVCSKSTVVWRRGRRRRTGYDTYVCISGRSRES